MRRHECVESHHAAHFHAYCIRSWRSELSFFLCKFLSKELRRVRKLKLNDDRQINLDWGVDGKGCACSIFLGGKDKGTRKEGRERKGENACVCA